MTNPKDRITGTLEKCSDGTYRWSTFDRFGWENHGTAKLVSRDPVKFELEGVLGEIPHALRIPALDDEQWTIPI